MRGLVALVTALGLLIILALGFVVYGFVRPAKTEITPLANAALMLPAGSTVKHMTALQDDLALYVTARNGEAIYLVDAKSGAIKSKIPVERQK